MRRTVFYGDNVPGNQINPTRRTRREEPRNHAERQEKVKRVGRTVLLAAAPLPVAEASRYRSRVYRVMAVSVQGRV